MHDARVPWLPERLSAKPRIVWEKKLYAKSPGGIAATRSLVIYSDRVLDDRMDAFHCVSADTGKIIWSYSYPAPGSLDYGNAPRTTPLIHDGLVYLINAFGLLHCLDVQTGKLVWNLDFREEFKAEDDRKWGVCSNPIVVDDKLIINPGGKEASLVALNPRTGKTIWKSPGRTASYGNFIAGALGGVMQIVGHDSVTLGGWDLATGKRLWEIIPKSRGDFNVPTPLQLGEHLLVTTENNRTRLYQFKSNGVIDPVPIALNHDLASDTHSPVALGNRLFGIDGRLLCMDLKNGLKTLWSNDHETYAGHGSLIASPNRLLVVSMKGDVVLVDPQAEDYRELGRWQLFLDDEAGYSHPALVGSRLYLRGNATLLCIELNFKE